MEFTFDSNKPHQIQAVDSVCALFTSQPRAEADLDLTLGAGLAVEEEAERDFQIMYEGRQSTLRIRFFMDDIDEAGIYIFSVPSLAEKVSLFMKQIIDEEAG